MRLAIDATPLLPAPTGVDVYIRSLVEHLSTDGTIGSLTLFINHEDRLSFQHLDRDGIDIRALCSRSRVTRMGFQQIYLPRLLRHERFDVLHSPSFLLPLASRAVRHVLTVHDMTFFTAPDAQSQLHRSKIFRTAVASSIHRANRIIVPSGEVRRQLLETFAGVRRESIDVIPHGIGPGFRPCRSDEVERARQALNLPPRYLLHVGGAHPRKNLPTLLAAFRQIAPEHPELRLVLAGEHSNIQADGVHPLGYVEQALLPALYAGAEALVYPSLDEGFGFPPLEAMACGTPVITSNVRALAEKLSDACLLVDPHNQVALAAAIGRILHDPALCHALRARGLERATDFTWSKAIKRTVASYHRSTE